MRKGISLVKKKNKTKRNRHEIFWCMQDWPEPCEWGENNCKYQDANLSENLEAVDILLQNKCNNNGSSSNNSNHNLVANNIATKTYHPKNSNTIFTMEVILPYTYIIRKLLDGLTGCIGFMKLLDELTGSRAFYWFSFICFSLQK